MSKLKADDSTNSEYIQLIENHIHNPRFRNDFFEVYKNHTNPDEFILLMEKRIKNILLEKKESNYYLHWALSQPRPPSIAYYRPIESAFYRLEEIQRQILGGYLAQEFHEHSMRRLFHDYTGGYSDQPVYPLAQSIIKALYLFKDLDSKKSIFKGLPKTDNLSVRNDFCDYLRANITMVECINMEVKLSESIRTKVMKDLLVIPPCNDVPSDHRGYRKHVDWGKRKI